MEDKFNHDEFEEFLQDQVRNHRMYPSDAVWREIDRKLHGEKRWPALTIAAAMLVGATVLICVYFTPKPDIFTIPAASANSSAHAVSDKNDILNNITSNITSSIPFKAKPASSAVSQNDLSGLVISSQTETKTAKELEGIVTTDITASTPSNSTLANNRANLSGAGSIIPVNVRSNTAIPDQKSVISGVNDEVVADTKIVSTNQDGNEKASQLNAETVRRNTDKYLANNYTNHNYDIPYTRKSAAWKNKFSYQIYVAPSVSYRKLLEDNSLVKENIAGPVGINYVTDVNKVVRHKPGTGIEAGVGIMYNISPKVRLKSGFQFNMRQYSIEAYRSSTELASIALIGNNRLDTIKTLAIYRTNNGYYSTKLTNRYYQLSAPIGIEWEIVGNKLIQLNVAGTIQPTYLLNRDAYLLSTNFKHYTESPGMIRQWNINSNIEAFISIKAGDYKWQLGPQLRYQPYSTFIPEYSIKEHLLDYGIKLGFSKTIR